MTHRFADPTPVVVDGVVKRCAAVTAVDGVGFAAQRGEVFALFTVVTFEKTQRVNEAIVSAVSPQAWIGMRVFRGGATWAG